MQLNILCVAAGKPATSNSLQQDTHHIELTKMMSSVSTLRMVDLQQSCSTVD